MMKPAVENSLTESSRWRIILLLMGFTALAHFNRVGIAVAGSEIFIPQNGITETRMGWVYTAFLITYTLGMLPGGWLIDRIGAAGALLLLGLSMGTFVALTGTLGWSTSTSESLWLGLMVIRGLTGPCSAPLHPGAAHVVSDVMPGSGRATANGMVTAGALLGIAACYPVFGFLMDQLTWPRAFVVSGLALIGYGAIWRLFALPHLPHPRPPETSTREERIPEAHLPSGAESGTLLQNRSLWLIALSYAAYGYFQYLFFYWMGHYFENVLHVPKLESRQITSLILLAMGAGMAAGGLSTDFACRILGRTQGRRVIILTGMGLGAGFALLAVQFTGKMEVAVCLALSMAALGMCEGVFWTTATDIGGKARGFAGAFMNTWGNVGGLISPVLTPAMAKQMGWPGAIAVACFISGAGGLAWFWIKPPPATTGNE